MTGIDPVIELSVTRLLVEFVDSIGNTRNISGTGFWLAARPSSIFVTNRHNLDPTMKFGQDSDLRLGKLEIQHRAFEGPFLTPSDSTSFEECVLDGADIRISDSGDVALIVSPRFVGIDAEITHSRALRFTELATEDFFQNDLNIMDPVSFIGYPGTSRTRWWDTVTNRPIARGATIASAPSKPFINPSVKTGDVTLVSGLSFGGSSGSIVVSHQKGIPLGEGIKGPKHVAPRIIGVMSGHWWDEGSTPDMFRHSGLSHFTRATSITDLMDTD